MEGYGEQLLREVKQESLFDLLFSVQQALDPHPALTNTPLDTFTRLQNGRPKIGIVGRGMPLIYHLVNTLLTPSSTVCIIDVTHRFSPSHLDARCRRELEHLHVFFPVAGTLAATLRSLETYMEGGTHRSMGRKWVATLVIGGVGGDVWVAEGWKGWLVVEREGVSAYPLGVNASEVIKDRSQRQEVVENNGWRAAERGMQEYIFTLEVDVDDEEA